MGGEDRAPLPVGRPRHWAKGLEPSSAPKASREGHPTLYLESAPMSHIGKGIGR